MPGLKPIELGTTLVPLYFIDPKALFQAFLNFNAALKMYKGIAYLVDNPIELYYTLY